MYNGRMHPVRILLLVVAVLAVSCTAGSGGPNATGPSTGSPTTPVPVSGSEPASPVANPCASAVPSPGDGGGSLIVFWSDSPYPSLWAVRPDGSDRHRIIRTPQNAKRPSISPDGRWVAFDGAPPGKTPLSEFHVQVVRLDGTGLHTIASTGPRLWELDAQWSPDGNRLSFDRMPAGAVWRRSRVWTVRPNGTAARRLGRGMLARWSPDGTKLVFAAPTPKSDGDLFVMNADGSGRQRLLANSDTDQPAAWSPDGTRILFSRFSLGMEGADVFVMDAAGTDVRRLTRARGDDIAAAWSPDGSKILFTSDRGGLAQLYVMDVDGCNQHKLTPSDTSQFDPSWR
jgi:TolB protein